MRMEMVIAILQVCRARWGHGPNRYAEQLGCIAVISIADYQCMAYLKMLPRAQRDQQGGLWNARTRWFAKDAPHTYECLSISFLDDRHGLTLALYSSELMDLKSLIFQIKQRTKFLITEQSITSNRAEFKLAGNPHMHLSELEGYLTLIISALGYIDQHEFLRKNTPRGCLSDLFF